MAAPETVLPVFFVVALGARGTPCKNGYQRACRAPWIDLQMLRYGPRPEPYGRAGGSENGVGGSFDA